MVRNLQGGWRLVVAGLALLLALLGPGPAGADQAAFMQLLQTAMTALNAGRLDAAQPAADQALAMAEKEAGPRHAATGMALFVVATVRSNRGDLAGAVPLLERSLAIQETADGVDPDLLPLLLNNLAAAYQMQGALAQAEPLLRRSLALLQAHLSRPR